MKKELLIATFAAALLAGCSNDENTVIPVSGSELGVSVKVSTGVATRSFVSAFAENDKLGIFITGEGYTPHRSAYTKGASLWAPPSLESVKLFLSNNTATVYAFYPEEASFVGTLSNDPATTPNKIIANVPAAAASLTGEGTEQIDYMFGTSRAGSAGSYTYPLATASNATDKNKVDLYMHHALSKLSFVINKGVSYSGDGKVTKIELVKTDGLYAGSGEMNVADGSLTFTTPVSSVSFANATAVTVNAYNETTPSTNVVAKGIVAPIADASGITFKLTIDGKEMSAELTAPTGGKWIGGANYIYTVKVSGTGLDATSVTIQDWVDETVGGEIGVN